MRVILWYPSTRPGYLQPFLALGGGLERTHDLSNANPKLLAHHLLEKEHFHDSGDNFLLENDDSFHKVVSTRSLDTRPDMEFKETLPSTESTPQSDSSKRKNGKGSDDDSACSSLKKIRKSNVL